MSVIVTSFSPVVYIDVRVPEGVRLGNIDLPAPYDTSADPAPVAAIFTTRLINEGVISQDVCTPPAGDSLFPPLGAYQIINEASGQIGLTGAPARMELDAIIPVDVFNRGSITGDVTLGDAGDQLWNQESATFTGTLATGSGRDTVRQLGVFDGTLSTGAGSDTIFVQGPTTGPIYLGAGHDVLRVTDFDTALTVYGGGGRDQIRGSDQGDVLEGNRQNDVIRANEGDDWVNGGQGADTLYGAGGADVLIGGTGADVLWGGRGDDILHGGKGRDVLNGGVGDDMLVGGHDNDRLNGRSGNDTLDGGHGFDTVNGGTGDDVLSGGGGADVFVFEGLSGQDRIVDFGAEDRVDLRFDWSIDPLVPGDGSYCGCTTASIPPLELFWRLQAHITDMSGGASLDLDGFFRAAGEEARVSQAPSQSNAIFFEGVAAQDLTFVQFIL